MAARSLKELSLEFEKEQINQRFGPLLDSTVKEQFAEDWFEFDRISVNFKKARERYLNSLVLMKISSLPLSLMFIGAVIKSIDDGDVGWNFTVVPMLFFGLFVYKSWLARSVKSEQQNFASAVAKHDEQMRDVSDISVEVGWDESLRLEAVAEQTLQNAIKAIAVTRKAVSVKKLPSLVLGISGGLIIGLIIAAIGFFVTNMLGIFDPMFVSFLDFFSYLFFVVGLGLAALPYTDYNNLLSQLSGLIQDYCHYRDIASRFDLTNTAEFDRLFVAEIAEPSIFSSISPSLVIYKTSRWK